MVCLLCGDHRGIGGEHEVNARVWHQIGLELGDIHVQCTIEAQGGLSSAARVHLVCKKTTTSNNQMSLDISCLIMFVFHTSKQDEFLELPSASLN